VKDHRVTPGVAATDGQPAPGARRLAEATRAALSAGGALDQVLSGFLPRRSQQELAVSIAVAIEARESLVAEAGTGTGKTFAYLVPLLLSGARALVSTGTRPLQDQLYHRDLPAVRAALGLDFNSALLKGRSNYVCHHHLERNRQEGRFPDPGIGPRLQKIARFAAVSASGDRAQCPDVPEDDPAWIWATSTRENCLGQDCPESRRCFVMKARKDALSADVVVVNHHLFLADLILRDESMGELLPSVDAVIFDEAHQLPEAATEFFGESVSTRQLLDFSRDLVRSGLVQAPDGADWRTQADRLERSVRDLRLILDVPSSLGPRSGLALRPASIQRSVPAGVRRLTMQALRGDQALLEALEDLASELVSICALTCANAGRGPDLDRCGVRATELLERLQRWIHALDRPAPEAAPEVDVEAVDTMDAGASNGSPAVLWAEVSSQSVSLRRTPLSVADPFRRHREALPQAWIFVSATLAMADDFRHYTEALGLDAVRCERWESPFDFARQAALWIPSGIGEPNTPGFTARLAEAVWPLLCANRGRAFVLCTSLRGLREMAQCLRGLDDGTTGAPMQWLVQGEAPRAALLERFRTAKHPAVLIGSASFWEGVDVAGDALSVVVIDKLPFAPPDDPVLEARALALRQAGRDPFRDEQLPQAALALKQGAGRLIRSESDRGVLVIGDTRISSRSYGRRLLASLPPFSRVLTLEQALSFLPDSPERPPLSGG
jgi:ATP-dependent DNA helicase DinG